MMDEGNTEGRRKNQASAQSASAEADTGNVTDTIKPNQSNSKQSIGAANICQISRQIYQSFSTLSVQ